MVVFLVWVQALVAARIPTLARNPSEQLKVMRLLAQFGNLGRDSRGANVCPTALFLWFWSGTGGVGIVCCCFRVFVLGLLAGRIKNPSLSSAFYLKPRLPR